MKKIAVFASGNGSNFQAIYEAVESGTLRAEIKMLVCDKPGAFVVERARKAGVPVLEFCPKQYESKMEFETMLHEELQKKDVEYIVLAGYMRLIGSVLLENYPEKIINIHPSLLPAFPGMDAIGQAVASGAKVTGVTIHYVDEGMDTGPIIAQKALEIQDGATIEEIAQEVHEIEHEFYPETLDKLFEGKRKMEGAEE
ncbi:MAG TPA: phosphoribosylglycinamide formyltransferase [Bacillus bacterium]|uniref:Phosphoribosylglycinamide formyltransferase n=1 Tax=Siminovitchia fordii TaxID=254759 RepID=A0ABQ4KBD2_9BACI|nr:phosphoribosylglycinamide formyltransferase [Siminovitchia fordii]GIN23034.1 phosphoribosylglycinamide formyltransferase [Siminovitchia fordii]HBZ11067.1 phosphoribosylglycinamide formyltransferase [Bacillus sp. (in: firmicutes)]